MAKYEIMPEGDYEAWDIADTLEEAKQKRCALQHQFISRRVIITDENGREV